MTQSSDSAAVDRVDDFFRQVAWKYLKMVDLPYRGSNQHEIGGVAKLRAILGTSERKGIGRVGASLTKTANWSTFRG